MSDKLSADQVRLIEKIEVDAWEDMYLAASDETKAHLGLKVYRSGNVVQSIASGLENLACNRVIGTGVLGELDDNSCNEIKKRYLENKVDRFFVTVAGANKSTSPQVLTENGFYHYNNWVKLYRDASLLENVKSDLKVEQIGKNRQGLFGEIVVKAFEWRDNMTDWFTALVGRPHWYHYIAFDGNTPAAAALIYIKGKAAWISFAATLPEFTRRGAQAILSQARFKKARELGVELIAVETAEQTPDHEAPSYRNMLRYGFKEADIRPNYIFEHTQP